MTDDKPTDGKNGMPLSKRLQLPDNWRDVTAERAGTVIAVVGAEHFKPKRRTSKLLKW